MPWTWRLERPDGSTVTDAESPMHGSQSDAESWLGENWRELAEADVAQVRLFEDDREVYGPMPLAEG